MSDFISKEIEQEKARLEQKLAKLNEKSKKEANGQKIIIGGMMLSLAKKNIDVAKYLLKNIETEVTREHDKKRLSPVVEQLQKMIDEDEIEQQNRYQEQGITNANY